MKKKLLLMVSVLAVLLVTAAYSSKSETKVNTEPCSDRQTIPGTYIQIRICDDGKEDVLPKAFTRARELDDEITVNQPGSEIGEINQEAGVKPVEVLDDLYPLLRKVYRYSKDSRDDLDMTVGPITSMWHIGSDDARRPDQTEVDQTLKLVDYTRVKFSDKEQAVYPEEKGMQLDLGITTRGFIIDEVVKVLKDNGATTATADLDGNVYILGHSPRGKDMDWTVGIQDPNRAHNIVLGQVKESNKTSVTSETYEHYLRIDDKMYHYLFDRETGYPFDNDIVGVTTVADKSINGDGPSTAISLVGVKKGLEYVESLKETDTTSIIKDDKVYIGRNIEDNFEIGKDSDYTMGNRADLK